MLVFSNEVVGEQVVNELCANDAFHDANASSPHVIVKDRGSFFDDRYNICL